MIRSRLSIIVNAGFLMALIGIFAGAVSAGDVPRITKEQLKEMLEKPDVVIVDVRVGTDWDASEFRIKGAVREDPSNIDSWMDKYPKDKTLVFYCG